MKISHSAVVFSTSVNQQSTSTDLPVYFHKHNNLLPGFLVLFAFRC